MHIAVVFQHYTSPDDGATGRHYALMERWARQHRVTLVSAASFVPRQSRRFPRVPPGVTHIALDVPYTNAMTVGQRIRAFAAFAAGSLYRAARVDVPDVFLGVTTPPTAALAAALAARIRRRPWVLDVKDLWPDFPIQMGAVRSPLAQALLRRGERDLLRDARHIITLSPDMGAHVRRLGVSEDRQTVLGNGTDLAFAEAVSPADVSALRAHHGLEGRRVLLYAGTFGRANAIPLLIETARVAHARAFPISVVCVGDGFGRPALEQAAREIPTLQVLPPVPRHAIFAWFHLADLALVSFADVPVLGTTSPAKFFDALACGTPVAITNDGWMRRLVDETGAGLYASSGHPDAAAQIADFAASDARIAAATAAAQAFRHEAPPDFFDRTLQADRYLDIFERVVNDAAKSR